MKNEDDKNMIMNWIFIIIASMLGFFVSITANSVYDMLKHGIEGTIKPFIFGVGSTFIFTRVITWMFVTLEDKNDKKILLRWIKYEWKESKLISISIIAFIFIILLILF